MAHRVAGFVTVALLCARSSVLGQFPPGHQGSSNVHLLAHIPLGANKTTSDIELEQELSRPYAYVDRRLVPSGFDIINLKEPSRAYVMYSWRIENPELHQGSGSLSPAYLKSHGRYYFFNGFQFGQSGPDNDLAAIVFDVTGLPDTSKVKEVARVRLPETPGGFHETFSYKHSNGQALVIVQTSSPAAYIYDVDKLAAHDPNPVVGKAMNPTPPSAGRGAEGAPQMRPEWHDF